MRDSLGRPIGKERVELVAEGETRKPPVWTVTGATDGRFRFADVPLGPYVLTYDREGPRPVVREVQVNTAGLRLAGQDLRVGPPARFRTVDVRKRLENGGPTSALEVEVEGETGGGRAGRRRRGRLSPGSCAYWRRWIRA